MCTPQIRSAIAPPRSTNVKVVFILRAPCRTLSAYLLIRSRRGDQHTARQKMSLWTLKFLVALEEGRLSVSRTLRYDDRSDDVGNLFEISLEEHSNCQWHRRHRGAR